MEFVQEIQTIQNEMLALYLEKKAYSSTKGLSPMEKQVLGVYLFGMANGLQQKHFAKLTPVEVETAMIAVMMTGFDDTFLVAQEFVASIIRDVQSGNPENTVYVIVHRGLDGYFAWEQGQKEEVIMDLEQIFTKLS